MGAEDYLGRSVRADLHDLYPHRLVLARSGAPEVSPRALAARRLEQLKRLLPGVPERALALLADVSDALASGEAADDETNHDGAKHGAASPETLEETAARGRALLTGAEATVSLGRVLEGLQLELLAGLATTAGRELLAREHGATDPGELSRTARARWRARAKSVVAQELAAVSGFGIQDCHDRVGFALAPVDAGGAARAALHSGRSDWWQVWQWWKRCRQLDPGSAADVAQGVFPSAPEDSGDTRPPEVLSRRAFMERLDLEATRAEGQDPVAARAARAAAVERRRLRAVVDADGTGCLSLTGRTSTEVAAVDRIDAIARRARAAGDSRTLDQLRSDAALALLTSGTLPAPASPSAPTGDTDSEDGGADADRLDPAVGGGWDAASIDRLSVVLTGHAPATVEVVVPYDVITGANPDGVGLVTGHGHLTGEHAREVALTPGSTFYRLVTDPASGTLVDRSVDRYVPDHEMRSIVVAADRHCRGPGCTIPAKAGELDHVSPYPEGSTTISNLAALHVAHHGTKTNGWWTALIDPETREVSWTSFYDRCFRTAPFDYRTLDRGHPSVPGHRPAAHQDSAPSQDSSRSQLADLQDQLVYAALAHRDPGDCLGSSDEYLDPSEGLWAPRPVAEGADVDAADAPPISLTHTSATGKTRPGAPPRQPTPAELLPSAPDSQAEPHAAERSDGPPPPSPDDEPPPF